MMWYGREEPKVKCPGIPEGVRVEGVVVAGVAFEGREVLGLRFTGREGFEEDGGVGRKREGVVEGKGSNEGFGSGLFKRRRARWRRERDGMEHAGSVDVRSKGCEDG